MRDLISKSALIEALLQKKSLMAEIVGGRHPIAMEAVIEYIENFQCAYNVDKVVEQLEELRYAPEEKSAYNTGWRTSVGCAIEIVRKGGCEPAEQETEQKPLPEWKQRMMKTFLGRN